MNPVRKRRLLIVLAVLFGVSLAVGFGVYAMRSSIDLFVTPSDVVSGKAPHDQRLSVGGLVVEGSLKRGDGLVSEFQVTDNKGTVIVRYEGILPDLFREGKGIVVKGVIGDDNSIAATEVLAKHDENYMPPEAQEAIERAGHPAGAGKDGKSGYGSESGYGSYGSNSGTASDKKAAGTGNNE